MGLANSEPAGERAWRVAMWSTVGLGVPTVTVVRLALFSNDALEGLGWQSVAVITWSAAGSSTSRWARSPSSGPNTTDGDPEPAVHRVFLRLFRHDIRNCANTILGHTDVVAASESAPERSVEVLRRRIDHLMNLSGAARQLDELQSESATERVDLVALVEDQVAAIRASHPDVRVETDLPADATVSADDLLRSVVDNLLLNAVEHGDDQPRVRVAAIRSGIVGRSVELGVEDDGPGFTDDELAVHARSTETDLRHCDGIGLWLARWIVDAYGGKLAVDNADDGPAVVTVTLPSA